MRSHPYTTPAPLPPVLHDLADELASILPNQRLSYATDPNTSAAHRRASFSSDAGIELRAVDPETSRLLPPPTAARRRRHHVRVQGKLAVVRSVSTANLHADAAAGLVPPTPRYESAVGSVMAVPQRRGKGRAVARAQRRSLDGTARGVVQSETETDDEEDVEEEKREVKKRDAELRGYGIGGAGNIRRPTEVVQFASRREGPILSLPMLSLTDPDRKKWRIRELLGLAGDRKDRRKSELNTP